MKHIWVVEVSGADKWRPAGTIARSEAYLTMKSAVKNAAILANQTPGLRWRVAKYVREAK